MKFDSQLNVRSKDPKVEVAVFPLPPLMKAFFVALLLLVSLAALRMPAAVRATIQYDRALQSIADRNPQSALANLKSVVAQYPGSVDARMDLIRAYVQDNQFDEAEAAARGLPTDLSRRQTEELRELLKPLVEGVRR